MKNITMKAGKAGVVLSALLAGSVLAMGDPVAMAHPVSVGVPESAGTPESMGAPSVIGSPVLTGAPAPAASGRAALPTQSPPVGAPPFWAVPPPVDDGLSELSDAAKISALQSTKAVLDAKLAVEKVKADIRKMQGAEGFGDAPPMPQMAIPVRGESATQPRPPVSLIGSSMVGGNSIADILVEGQSRTVAVGQTTNVYNDIYTVMKITPTSITLKSSHGSNITVFGGAN